MANENLFQELTAQEEAIIAGGSGFNFDIMKSLLGNSIKQEEEEQDIDLDLVSFDDSFNFGGNSVK